MLRGSRLSALVTMAIGGLLGYAAASDRFGSSSPAAASTGQVDSSLACGNDSSLCSTGAEGGELLANAEAREPRQEGGSQPATDGKKPNILVIFGDDIGISNISAYSDGLMGYATPNIDRIAKEGLRFLHYYAEQSCTAGRAAFLTGQHGIRTGLTKVGFPGAPMGMSQLDP